MTENGRGGGESEREADEEGEASGDEEGRRGRNDEHRDYDDGADGFEGGNGGDRDHGHQEVVDDFRSEALGLGEAWVEGGEGEFLVEDPNDEDVEEEGASGNECGVGDLNEEFFRLEERDEIERSVFQSTIEDATGIEIDIAGTLLDQEESDRKEGGENDAHGGSTFDFTELSDPLGEERGEDSGESGPEEHPPTGAAS